MLTATTRKNVLSTRYVLFLVSIIAVSLIRSHADTSLRRRHHRTSTTNSTAVISFPSYSTALHFAHISHAVYYGSGCSDTSILKRLPPSVKCHSYTTNKMKTEVLVVSSDVHRYVAVCFAGTDNLKDVLHDVHVDMVPFGNNTDQGKVHAGFHNAVFSYGLYDKILSTVKTLLAQYPHYDVYTTGHSLGGADSILAGAALALDLKTTTNKTVHSLSYGTPMTGDKTWRHFIADLMAHHRLYVWRFVYKRDLIPRLPGVLYNHVGHTVQLDNARAEAYYLHYGNDALGYAGVPFGWTISTWLFPFAGYDHKDTNYIKYLKKKSSKNPDKYWVHDFARVDHLQLNATNSR